MKKSYIFNLLLAALLPLLGSCSQEDIIFDHELPQFDTREGYQLLEVIVPTSTTANDKLYIVGEFNGGLEAALADPRWQLEPAQNTDAKWGIYLNPADFVSGKTLADGYYFYSAEQREERTVQGAEVMHTEQPAVGGRINVTVGRWAAYDDKPLNPDEVVHDGYAIFVVDNSGYDELAMYAWGDAEAFGGWPGMAVTGKITIDGVEYMYFDTGEANKGLNLNLIFNNNNNGSQLGDYNVTLDKDYYLELTPDGVQEFDPSAVVKHDGFAVFVADYSGWDDLYLYMWGDVNDLNGAWPGMEVTGTQKINGVEYKYFDLGEANIGNNEHIILNNGNGKQIDDVVVFALDRDVYVELTASKATEVDPSTYTGQGGGDDPVVDPDPVPTETYHLYVADNTGWEAFYIYAWGDKECFGGWPGAAPSGTKTISGKVYQVFEVEGAGETENLIFHNNDGTQYDAAAITLDKDYIIEAGAASCTVEEYEPVAETYTIYVEDKTGWPALYIYAWGDKECFGGWPGAAPSGTEKVDGITYKPWDVEGLGDSENLIFHNNDGTQYDALGITLDRNYFIIANPTSAEEKK